MRGDGWLMSTQVPTGWDTQTQSQKAPQPMQTWGRTWQGLVSIHNGDPDKGLGSEYTMQGGGQEPIPLPPGHVRSGVTVAVMSGQTA